MTRQREAKWKIRDRRYRRDGGPEGAPRKGSYIWRIAPADVPRTRSGHLALNGKTFRWDDPPVINARTGERGHPGHDRNCRCYAEPVAGQSVGPEPGRSDG